MTDAPCWSCDGHGFHEDLEADTRKVCFYCNGTGKTVAPRTRER